MNDQQGNAQPPNTIAPLEPGKAPTPSLSRSQRVGPDPARSTSTRITPNGGYVPEPAE